MTSPEELILVYYYYFVKSRFKIRRARTESRSLLTSAVIHLHYTANERVKVRCLNKVRWNWFSSLPQKNDSMLHFLFVKFTSTSWNNGVFRFSKLCNHLIYIWLEQNHCASSFLQAWTCVDYNSYKYKTNESLFVKLMLRCKQNTDMVSRSFYIFLCFCHHCYETSLYSVYKQLK